MTRTAPGLHLKIESDPSRLASVRQQIEGYCRQSGLPAKACEEVGLCVNEALANVIRHAYHKAHDRPIEIKLDVAAGQLKIFIRDWGCGADPTAALNRPYDPLKPGGLGLICMNKMMSHVAFCPQPDGMLLKMSRNCQSLPHHG